MKTTDNLPLRKLWQEHEDSLVPPVGDPVAMCRRRDAMRRENIGLALGAGILVTALALTPSGQAVAFGSAHAIDIVDNIISMQ